MADVTNRKMKRNHAGRVFRVSCVINIYLLLVPASVTAEEQFAIAGAGAITCSGFLTAPQGDKVSVLSWVQGFLSGMNSYRYVSQKKEMVPLPSNTKTMESLVDFCKKSDTKTLLHASINLWNRIDSQN